MELGKKELEFQSSLLDDRAAWIEAQRLKLFEEKSVKKKKKIFLNVL